MGKKAKKRDLLEQINEGAFTRSRARREFSKLSKKEKLCIASNPDTLGEYLDELFKEDDPEIRREIASNPNALSSTLGKAVMDVDEGVQIRAIRNPITPDGIIYKRMLQESGNNVKEEVAYRLKNFIQATNKAIKGDSCSEAQLKEFLEWLITSEEVVEIEGEIVD